MAHLRKEPSYVPLLILGGAVLVGGGIAVAMLARKQMSSLSPPADTGGLLGASNEAPAPSQSTVATTPAADPNDAEVALYYTKASTVLAKQVDQYNKGLRNIPLPKTQNAFLPDDPGGKLYNSIRGIIGSVPVVGPIVNTVFDIVQFLGPLIVGDSKGGFDDLGPLVKERAYLYFVVPNETNLLLERPFKSQLIDPTAPTERPTYQVGFGPINANYVNQYKAWLRRYLQEQAIYAEFYRITKTFDEVMLPAVVINVLYDSALWPPPIEPMPLTVDDFRQRYKGTENPIVGYQYPEGAGTASKIIQYRDPPAWQARDLQLASEVYQTLYDDYSADAARYQQAVVKVSLPEELLGLAFNSGMVPRYGSPANPAGAQGPQPLGSPQNPIQAPSKRVGRL